MLGASRGCSRWSRGKSRHLASREAESYYFLGGHTGGEHGGQQWEWFAGRVAFQASGLQPGASNLAVSTQTERAENL